MPSRTNWHGEEWALQLPDMNLLQQAIDEVALLNAEDPSLAFWRTYQKASRGLPVTSTELQSLERYSREDHEFVALYAQIGASLKNRELALHWLRNSIKMGNYDIIQMNHPNFHFLSSDPEFRQIRSKLQRKIKDIIAKIQPLVFRDSL